MEQSKSNLRKNSVGKPEMIFVYFFASYTGRTPRRNYWRNAVSDFGRKSYRKLCKASRIGMDIWRETDTVLRKNSLGEIPEETSRSHRKFVLCKKKGKTFGTPGKFQKGTGRDPGENSRRNSLKNL